jgi:DNA polymerase I-like protein with 3'-5' exonuclease and polymerase domains
VIEAPDDEVDVASTLTREIMEGVVALDVPLSVELATGATLADTKS